MTAIFPFVLSLSLFFYSVDVPLIRHKFLDLHFILEVSYTVCRSTEHCWNFRMRVYVCVRSYQWIPGTHLPPSAFLGCDESGIQQRQPVIHSLHFSQMASHCPLTSQSRITPTHIPMQVHTNLAHPKANVYHGIIIKQSDTCSATVSTGLHQNVRWRKKSEIKLK